MRQAAGFLHQEELYPAVAHSAYYSCLQLCKCLWLHQMSRTQDDLDAECKTRKTGTHDILIDATYKHVLYSGRIGCSFDARNITKLLSQLKRLRTVADYSDVEILEKDSADAISLSEKIHPLLEKYL